LRHLSRGFAAAINAVGVQHALGGRVDRIPNLFGAGRGARNFKIGGLRCRQFLLHQAFHNELGHGASANVAVAYKKDFNHAVRQFSSFCIVSKYDIK
jgi:hypothetical protein